MYKSDRLLEKEVRLAEVKQSLKEVQDELNELQKTDILIECQSSVLGKGCGTFIPIGELTYIQTKWYTPPRGCSEGDYWNDGEGQFDCPKCGNRNRMYKREVYENYKRSFGHIEVSYDER